MARPADPALARAIREVIKGLRSEGWTTRQLAERLGVADPTVIRWENGGRVPALDLLPKLDELCGRPRGHVLRLAGYVDDPDGGMLGQIEHDAFLDERGRRLMAGLYSELRRPASSAQSLEKEASEAKASSI